MEGIRGRFCATLVALALVVTACTSAAATAEDDPAPSPDTTVETTEAETPPVPAETATAEPAETPTEEPEPPTAEELEAVAIAAFDANPPEGLFAFDLLEAERQGTRDVVELTVCGWDGTTVDDDLYLATYRVNAEAARAPTATFESITTTPGDCTNTELIETALQTTRDYDNYLSQVVAAPASFDSERAADFITPALLNTLAREAEERVRDGVGIRNTELDGALPASSVQTLLTRTYLDDDEIPTREILACRDLPENYGLYRGDVLVDDFRVNVAGPSAVFSYRMNRTEGSWLVATTRGAIWVDCSGTAAQWVDSVNNSSFADPVEWKILQ